MRVYKYLMRLRPPGPGAQPRRGLLEVEDDPVKVGNWTYHGILTYDRRLSEDEVLSYELTPFEKAYKEANGHDPR